MPPLSRLIALPRSSGKTCPRVLPWSSYQRSAGAAHHLYLVDQATGTETPSALPMIAYVSQLERFPWDGHGQLAPQVCLEIDVDQPRPLEGKEAVLQAQFLERMKMQDPEPFGGLSGGPVGVIGTHGASVIATVREGKSLFSGARISLPATP